MNSISYPALRGLPDLCSDLFSLALELRRGAIPDDHDALRRRIDAMLANLDHSAKDTEIDGESVKSAQYAIVAFLDEILLGADWPGYERWSRRPLQLHYFDDVTAGERFYKKLDALRGTKEPEKLDALEVYATCLALGFKGKFSGPEDAEKPRLLVSQLVRELRSGRRQHGDQLSIHWKPEDYVPKSVRHASPWIVLGVCAFVIVALFVLLDLRLGAEMRALPGSSAPTSVSR